MQQTTLERYAEKWSSEKFPLKIVLRQKNARKFKWLFHFYQLIPLHTQENVWRLRYDPTYVQNCRTLKESRKICCRVLSVHRLIASEHSTHTHTHTHHDAQRSPHDFLFPVLASFPSFVFVVESWVFMDWSHPNIPHTHHDARRPPHDFSFLSFLGTIFPGGHFPGTIFPGFIEIDLSLIGTIFVPVYSIFTIFNFFVCNTRQSDTTV